MNGLSINELESEMNAKMPDGVEFKFTSKSVDKHGFSLFFKKDGKKHELEYLCQCDEAATVVALGVSKALTSDYVYSHSCTEESAEDLVKRTSLSEKASRHELDVVLGVDVTTDLERQYGRNINEVYRFFYVADDKSSVLGYSASIMNIDYVFVVKGTVSEGLKWN